MSDLPITLQQLRTFAAVAERGTMTQAAHVLHLSQPAVSAHITQLERLVGAPLFARQGRRTTLTSVGATLYRHAGNVLSATDTLLQHVERLRSGDVEHVTVGGNPTSCAYVLPDLLARYHRDHPNTRLTLVAAQSPELVEQVRRDAVDVAILSIEHVPDDFPSELLGIDHLVVAESAEHPISAGGSMTLAEVSRAPFVRPTIGSDRLTIGIDHVLAERGLEPRRFVMDLTTWDGVKEAVRMGVGLAVCPRGVVQRELQRGDLRAVAIPGFREVRSMYLVQSPRWQSQPAARDYADLLQRLRTEVPTALGLEPPEPSPQ
jgi:DNA-binding transcriptional LysR family regulator